MNYFTGELYHHGIKGQKWGIRRFQNPDGTLTSAGRERYGAHAEERSSMQLARQYTRQAMLGSKEVHDRHTKFQKENDKLWKEIKKKYGDYTNESHEFIKKQYDKFASITLKELGYEDTQAAKDYLKSLDWFRKSASVEMNAFIDEREYKKK